MKKLKLNLDDLKVESFATTPDASSSRGTVFGQDPTVYPEDTCYLYCTDVGSTCVQQCGTGGSENGTCAPAETCVSTCEPQATCPSPTCGVSCGGGELTNCPGETACDPEPTWTAEGCTLCDQVC